MVRDHLSEELKEAGLQLLLLTDRFGMSAQGAMWIHSEHFGYWRYYLVTSLIDTLGRRKTYQLLLQAFRKSSLPLELTVADVHLGSPADPIFQAVSSALRVQNSTVDVRDCVFNGVQLNAVIYRSVRDVPAKNVQVAIEKKFVRTVKAIERAA